MIDVNKITSTLAKLQDPQLQQYAQMHKNDPYIMALAMSESNRRKELRAASQGAQGMQEQPKVVDQEIARMGGMQNPSPEQMARLAQMLEARKQAEYEEFTGGRQAQPMPEDQGIGQLPAGDMNFAGGGIIAFADGGDVERFNGSQSQFVQDVAGIPGMYDKWWQANRESDRIKAEQERAMEQRRQAELAARQKTSFANYLFGSPEREAEGKVELAQLATAPVGAPARSGSMPEQGYTRPGMLYDPRLATPATMPVASDAAPPAAPTADTGRKAPKAGLEAAAAAKADTGPSDIDALQQKYFGAIDQEVGGLRNARAGLVAGIKDLTEKNLAVTKADIEKRGDVYKGREERLAKQEKGLEGMGDKNMGLALLQAGAAMMSTPGGLGAALGKGVQVGSERYAAGLDKIEAAKSKFAEARDRLDDLRINRDDMNTKDIRAAEKEARESELKGKELLYNGLVSDLGVKQKNVTAIFGAAADALKSDKQIAAERENTRIREGGANARSAAQIAASLNTPDRALWDQLMKKNGNDATKALEEFKLAKGDKFDVRSSYADYLKAFAGKEGLTPPMSMGAYAGQFGATLPR